MMAVLIITPLLLVAGQCSEDSSGHGFNRAEKAGESNDLYRSAEGRSAASAERLFIAWCVRLPL
jgi:hypothetical protein